jgi:uncharacterized repeat protein (TIGR03803 family)
MFPIAPSVQGRDGNFYGTTPSSNDGNIDGIAYQLTSGGKRTLLYLFAANGYNPQAPFILGADGNFYGTTAAGGKTTTSNCFDSTMSCGTVFKMTPAGKVTFLYQFDQVNGAKPLGPLVQGTDGNFYGTTAAGGDANGDGVIFKLTSQGKITILHKFNGTDGKQPTAQGATGTSMAWLWQAEPTASEPFSKSHRPARSQFFTTSAAPTTELIRKLPWSSIRTVS